MPDKQEQLYYVCERITGDDTKTVRYLTNDPTDRWQDTENAMLYFEKDAIIIADRWRDIIAKYPERNRYEAEYFIEKVEPNVLTDFAIALKVMPKPSNDFKPGYDYIAAFVVDLRHEPDWCILDRQYMSCGAGLDADMYYSECVENADLNSFMSTNIFGKLEVTEAPGVYRLVFEVNCHSSESWTDCGLEYDAWETYNLISRAQFDEQETKYMDDREEELHHFLCDGDENDTVTITTKEYDDLLDRVSNQNSGINKIGDGM